MADQSTRTVSVGTTAVRLDDPGIGLNSRVTYYNAGAVDVWLGGPGVVSGAGIKLPVGGTADEVLSGVGQRWAVVASSTCNVVVDQVRV